MQDTPLRGVGGAFIIIAIAVCTLLLLHGLLYGVGNRKAEVLAMVSADSDGYSEVWFGRNNDNASTVSNTSTFRGFGKRLRKTLSFKLPNGSWHHSDSNPSRSGLRVGGSNPSGSGLGTGV